MFDKYPLVALCEAQRDRHYATVAEKEVLAKGQRALIIMGARHLLRGGSFEPDVNVIDILDKRQLDAAFVLLVHAGFKDRTTELERRLSS